MARIFFHAPGAELSQSEKIVIQSIRYHTPELTLIHKVRHTVRPGDTVFNFGDGGLPDYSGVKIINPRTAILKMVDKALFFASAPTDLVPEHTTNKVQARAWQAAGIKVVAHVDPRGARGEGIKLVGYTDELPDAPLYTRFVNSVAEYRIIVVAGRVRYASHRHGTRFERSIMAPPHVTDVAERLCTQMRFDFAGLDVLDLGETALVCEANSAPLFTYAVGAAVSPYLGQMILAR